jgi:uncharacterized membrane protein (UPF0127 family)
MATLTLLGAACGGSSGAQDTVQVRIGELEVTAELALTVDERALGLGFRPQIPQNAGMLFVFPEERNASFWMRGMRFPLDFIWIDAGRRVIGVTENVPPPESLTPDSELPFYESGSPVQYVLEVNAGVIEATGVTAGDTVEFEPDVSPEDAS